MRVHRQLLTGIWRRVHPDLFEQQPAARAVNERSMKQLTSLIDGASELHSALIKGSATPASPEPCELRFFVHDEGAPASGGGLREVHHHWRPPTHTARLPPQLAAQRWASAAEECAATLLQRLTNSDEGVQSAQAGGAAAPDPDREPPRPGSLLHAAQQAAARRHARDGTGPTPSAAAAAEAAAAVSRAAARVAARAARTRAEEAALRHVFRRSAIFPKEYAHASAHAEQPRSEQPRSVAESAILLSEELQRSLLCDKVALERIDASRAHECMRALVHQRAHLRAALDASWEGISIRCSGERRDTAAAATAAAATAATAAASGVASHCELRDADGGGIELLVHGELGAASAAAFAREHWHALRLGQHRHRLLTGK